MNKKNHLKILIGVICVVLALSVTVAILIFHRGGAGDVQTNPTGSADQPQTPTTPTGEPPKETDPPYEEPIIPPEDQPPSVVIPPEKDPETGEEIGISFPSAIPGYDISI